MPNTQPVSPQATTPDIPTRLNTEQWDDLDTAVYWAEDTELLIPMPVPGVLEITAQAELANAGSLVVKVDGSTANSSTSAGSFITVVVVACPEVTQGIHEITLESTEDISSPCIRVRRGRAG